MVTEVEGSAAYVDPHPGVTDRLKSKLGWNEKDEEDFRLGSDEIAQITDDEVRLAGHYHKKDS